MRLILNEDIKRKGPSSVAQCPCLNQVLHTEWRSVIMDKIIKTLSFVHGSRKKKCLTLGSSTIQEHVIKALLLLY